MSLYPWSADYTTRPTMPGRYREVYDIDTLRRAFEDAGSHFFDPQTMRFFNSRVLEDFDPLADGTLAIITSERFRDAPRNYTPRIIAPDLTMTEPWGFCPFRSARQARAALRRYALALADAGKGH